MNEGNRTFGRRQNKEKTKIKLKRDHVYRLVIKMLCG
jgi:hypothetical protein